MNSSTKLTKNQEQNNYQLKVDRKKCISAASCVAIAPKSIQLDDEEIASIIYQDCESDETKLLAAQSCPTGAIKVIKRDTGEQVWPKVE